MKIVINNCYGGFSLSKEGMKRYCEIKNIPAWIEDEGRFGSLGIFNVWTTPPDARLEIKEGEDFYVLSMEDRKAYNEAYRQQTINDRDIPRHDPALVQLVEEDSKKYSGRCAELKVVDIPDDVEYQIEEYDGNEWVAEVHRTWS